MNYQEIIAKVEAAVNKVKPNSGKAYDPEQSLQEQGFDSLDMIDVLFNLQQELGFEVDEDSLASNEWISIHKIATQIEKIKATRKVD